MKIELKSKTMKTIHGYKLASKGKRLIATTTEALISLLIIFGIFKLYPGGTYDEFWESLETWEATESIDIIYYAVSGLIFGAVFYPIFSGNLGHKIFNLKVISEETGEDFNLPEKGGIRECLKCFLCYLVLPVIWILWDEKNQNLYDKLTKTLVVEKDKNNMKNKKPLIVLVIILLSVVGFTFGQEFVSFVLNLLS